MSHRFEVPPTSRVKIRRAARALRQILWQSQQAAVDVIAIVELTLPSLDPEFEFHVVEDHELKGREAETWPDRKIIRVTESVYRKACMGDNRARFTIAHELGHLFLHRGIGVRLARVQPNQEIDKCRDSEWQADTFGGEFLMDAALYAGCRSVNAASHLFKVSYTAAKVQGKAYLRDGLIPSTVSGLD